MKSTHLHLDLGRGWIRGRLQETRGFLRARTDGLLEANRSFSGEEGGLDAALRELATEMTGAGVRLRGVRLQAQLGTAHAYMGLMQLDQDSGIRLTPPLLQSYVEAWVEHTLHRDPGAHILRWQVLRDPHHILVSCIRSDTYGALATFAEEHGLRFEGCIPAVLPVMRGAGRHQTRTIVWTEGLEKPRDPAVQLVQLARGQVRAAWRGWVPAPEGADDAQLKGAVDRFIACHGADGGDQPAVVQWPFDTTVA